MADRDEALARWGAVAHLLDWERPFHTVFEDSTPQGRWFLGGRLNAAVNCLDRHLSDRGDVPAIHWEGEPGDRRTLTYRQLHGEVCALAGALADLGVGPGDRVVLHLGWIPETVVAMLACARLGATHTLLPAPLPPDALADRLGEVAPKVLITQDGAWRHGVILPLKARADEALAAISSINYTIVVRRTGVDVAWYEGDRWFHELVAPSARRDGAVEPAVAMPADHPLFTIYLASWRGRPTGIVHRTGGLLAYAAELQRTAFAPDPDDVLWCAVDVSWMAGQVHGIYGPLACGGTAVMFEGMLDTPTHDRAWQIIARYGVTTLVTTPSVVRNLRQWIDCPPGEQVATLRRIITVGEPIEPDDRAWLATEVGRGQAAVAESWGQTELGGVVTLTPAPQPPLPDPGLDIVDHDGGAAPTGGTGELVLRHPWPGTFHALLGDGGRAAGRYWREPGVYATDDLARREPDGDIVILGRATPVVSVSGQLVSATEVRDVLLEHPFVAAAEVVDRPDRRSGQAVVACVVLQDGNAPGTSVARELRAHVYDTLGGLAQPRTVVFCEALPSDVPRATVRRALRMLCTAETDETIRLSTARIRAAMAATAPTGAKHTEPSSW